MYVVGFDFGKGDWGDAVGTLRDVIEVGILDLATDREPFCGCACGVLAVGGAIGCCCGASDDTGVIDGDCAREDPRGDILGVDAFAYVAVFENTGSERPVFGPFGKGFDAFVFCDLEGDNGIWLYAAEVADTNDVGTATKGAGGGDVFSG